MGRGGEQEERKREDGVRVEDDRLFAGHRSFVLRAAFVQFNIKTASE